MKKRQSTIIIALIIDRTTKTQQITKAIMACTKNTTNKAEQTTGAAKAASKKTTQGKLVKREKSNLMPASRGRKCRSRPGMTALREIKKYQKTQQKGQQKVRK